MADEPVMTTRDHLLRSATEVFAEFGYEHATIKEICSRAGANIAAVNYHFRDKENLYRQVLKLIIEQSTQSHPIALQYPPVACPQEKLRLFIRAFLSRGFNAPRFDLASKIFSHEKAAPTFGFNELFDAIIFPLTCVLRGIVREILGPDAPDANINLHACSIISQCVFYFDARPVVARFRGKADFTPQELDGLADHITRFSLHGAMPNAVKKAAL